MAFNNFVSAFLGMFSFNLVRFVIVLVGRFGFEGDVRMRTSVLTFLRHNIPHVQI